MRARDRRGPVSEEDKSDYVVVCAASGTGLDEAVRKIKAFAPGRIKHVDVEQELRRSADVKKALDIATRAHDDAGFPPIGPRRWTRLPLIYLPLT